MVLDIHQVDVSSQPMMARTQILLPPALLTWLKAESDRLGISVSELIRRYLDAVREKKS
jgi:hypothetical protein